ncbi:hypothetical protein J4438_00550 [Candidatus Woesearchaeota archaeon]|nr:hypothetical protein [Candidatus Woesearchaeota archaeon]
MKKEVIKKIDKELLLRFMVYVNLVDSTIDKELNLIIAQKLKDENLMNEEEFKKILNN